MNSLFNYKKKVRKQQDNKNTLDHIHNKKIEEMINNKKNINSYKTKLKNLKKQYDKLNKEKNPSDEMIEQKINLNDDIVNIENIINKIENNKNEEEYFLNCGDILFQYYDNMNIMIIIKIIQII